MSVKESKTSNNGIFGDNNDILIRFDNFHFFFEQGALSWKTRCTLPLRGKKLEKIDVGGMSLSTVKFSNLSLAFR